MENSEGSNLLVSYRCQTSFLLLNSFAKSTHSKRGKCFSLQLPFTFTPTWPPIVIRKIGATIIFVKVIIV